MGMFGGAMILNRAALKCWKLVCPSGATSVWTPLLLTCFLWQAVLVEEAAALSPDGLVLLDFKSHIINADETELAGWNESDDTPCEWYGVDCDPDDASSVAHLGFPSLAYPLVGSLSSSLGTLANLSVLNLNGNKLAGRIPTEIVNAKLLRILVLSSNEFTGSIPANISQLRSLEFLDLSNNSLSGSIPSLDSLTNLSYLMLNDNDLSGQIPNLKRLKSLQYLYLGPGNNFDPWKAPDLSGLQELQGIYLQGSQIEGQLPTGIANMPALTELDLSANHLSGHIPEQIWGNRTFNLVDLSSNRLNGSVPGHLIQQIQGPELLEADISGHLTFGVLNLSSNYLTGRIPDNLNVTRSPRLLTIDVSNNQLDGPIPSTWGLASCEKVWLHNNRLSGNLSSVWSVNSSRTSNLTQLQLQGNQLTGDIGAAICAKWKNMELLDLGWNSVRFVDDSLFTLLDTCPNLRELRLSNIMSSGKLVALMNRTLAYKLEILDLRHSNLEGDLSRSLMAEAHFLFPHLKVLDLSGNRLTGQVPAGLAFMANLTTLNLSNNFLSGQLPPFFANATVFAGNPKLCGAPLRACKRPRNPLIVKLVTALLACLLISAGSCLLLAWRWRVYSRRHQQDADLIFALQGRESANLMPLADLAKATGNFSKTYEIGVGGFGTVYKGKLSDGTTVAIKRSKRQGSQEDKDQFLNEVKILSQVHHRNLVRLLGCCLANRTALLVLEYIPNGTLKEHLRGKKFSNARLTWWQRLRIAMQTADALAYLHESADPPIIHRDVKSANILLDEAINAKVADFGVSKLASLENTHVSTRAIQGTFGYIDPDYYTRSQLTTKSDVYSFGVVLLEIISALQPVDLRRGEEASLVMMAVPLIISGEFEDIIDSALSETSESGSQSESIVGVANLAVKCLEFKPRSRPTMREVWKELQALWLQVDTTLALHVDTTLGSSNQLPGTQLPAGMEDTPEDTTNSTLTNSSCTFPGSSSSTGAFMSSKSLP